MEKQVDILIVGAGISELVWRPIFLNIVLNAHSKLLNVAKALAVRGTCLNILVSVQIRTCRLLASTLSLGKKVYWLLARQLKIILQKWFRNLT